MSGPTTGPGRERLRELERTTLLQGLGRRHRRRVLELAVIDEVEPGRPIVRAGEAGDAFYVILTGEAEAETQQGAVAELGPGDHFGELSLIDGAPRAATVRAVGRVTLARIPREAFAELLTSEPELAVSLLPGMVLVIRDLLRADASNIPDHRQVGAWRRAEGETPLASDRAGDFLEGRDALGWLLLLRHVDLFAALPDQHLRRVAALFSVVRFPDGATVVVAGMRGDAMYVVLDGSARVRTPGGHLRLLGPDDCFGELALIDGAPRSATVSAVGELTTAKVGRRDFQKLLKAEPGIAVGLLQGLVRTVRDMQESTRA